MQHNFPKIRFPEVLQTLVCHIWHFTLMCLSIGTPKIINFPFVPNGKFIIFRCPKIWANYSLTMMCSNIGTPNITTFSIWDKWKSSGVRCPNT